jgi:NAD+ kinase
MFNKIHIVQKLNAADDPNVRSVSSMIKDTIIQRAVLVDDRQSIRLIDHTKIDENTLVIAVGGDGTMLEAMRFAHNKNATATGINLGNVGFLTDFPNDDDLQKSIEFLIDFRNLHPTEERICLCYHLIDKNLLPYKEAKFDLGPCVSFNEFVISNEYSDHLIKYNLYIGDRCAGVYRANALIIGTPTGSTAYSLSVGGGLLLPTLEAMQIVPVAPVSLTSRAIIIPSQEQVSLSIETQGHWILKSDGRTIGIFDNNQFTDTQLVITQSPTKVKILHHKDWSFFDMLTQKLGWISK